MEGRMADPRQMYHDVLSDWHSYPSPGMLTFGPPTGPGMVVVYTNDWTWEYWADAGDRFEFDGAHSGDTPASLKEYLCSLSLPAKP